MAREAAKNATIRDSSSIAISIILLIYAVDTF